MEKTIVDLAFKAGVKLEQELIKSLLQAHLEELKKKPIREFGYNFGYGSYTTKLAAIEQVELMIQMIEQRINKGKNNETL